MIDVDGFKAVNDAHGHAAGDGVLASVAARLRAAMREGEVVGRFGGDEFCMLLTGGGIGDAAERADRLRAQVEQSARQARDVSDQRALLQSLVNGARFLDEKSARQPGALQVWNELSQLLPAGTYLEKMGIENGSLQLIGLTREANQLVSLLEPSPLWRRVNLTGVLQADQAANGRDRFTLTAELQAAPTRPAPVQETADAASAKQP